MKKPAKKPRPKTLKTKEGPNKPPYVGWDLFRDGVSQSLLQKFVVDRDRYHRHAVQGLRVVDRKESMLFGTIFHRLCEEAGKLGRRYSKDNMLRVTNAYAKSFRNPEDVLLCKVALRLYFEYRKWAGTRPAVKYIENEPVFDEWYEVPGLRFNPNPDISIRIPKFRIRLRGRIDEVIDCSGNMWIGETKTKSRIDVSLIHETLHCNIQVMVYALCSQLKFKRRCKGVIYNVIRKPGLKLRKNDTEQQYLNRVTEAIQKDPGYYFMRFEHSFPAGAIRRWEKEEFQPLLYQVYLWWRSIEANPTHPWTDVDGNVNPFHGRKSFGVFDSMTIGKGEFFDLVVHGRKRNIVKSDDLFPELENDDE